MNFHQIKQVLQSEHTLLAHEWKGAVLFLCDAEFVYLIKRAEGMPTHRGQIAFVGGHKKVHEINPWDVAQREFEEETGFGPEVLKFMGFLPVVMTARLSPIVPVVAHLQYPSQKFIHQAASNGEWDDILAYPWKELLDERHWNYAWRTGFTRQPVMFHTIRAKTFLSPHGHDRAHLLWGATASMVWDFLRLYFGHTAG